MGLGAEENTSRDVFNLLTSTREEIFIDTADLYTAGTSDKMVGKFITERSLRDRVVLATKFTFNSEPGNPNAGGNGRKNIYRALEGSLKRLQTDYIDLYWLHAWDTVTPAEEVVSSRSTTWCAREKIPPLRLFPVYARLVRGARPNYCRDAREGKADRASVGILTS